MSADEIVFKANNGNYLATTPKGLVTADKAKITENSEWGYEKIDGNRIALISDFGTYLEAKEDGSVSATSSEINGFCHWKKIKHPTESGKYAFRSSTGGYLQVTGDGKVLAAPKFSPDGIWGLEKSEGVTKADTKDDNAELRKAEAEAAAAAAAQREAVMAAAEALRREEEEKKLEEERRAMEAERKRLEEDRARFEAEKAKLMHSERARAEAEQRRLDLQRQALEAEKARIAAEMEAARTAHAEAVRVQKERSVDIKSASKFVNGSIVHLRSAASGRNLRILSNGTVDGKGGNGRWAQFIVHTQPDGTIRLQNVGDPSHYLRNMKNDTVDGRGGTGPLTLLRPLDNPNGTISLLSVQFNTHVGVLPNGTTKPPSKTGRGLHGQFFLIPLSAPLAGKFEGCKRHAVVSRHAVTASFGGTVTLSSSSDSSSSEEDVFKLFGLGEVPAAVKQQRVQRHMRRNINRGRRGKERRPLAVKASVGGAGAWWL